MYNVHDGVARAHGNGIVIIHNPKSSSKSKKISFYCSSESQDGSTIVGTTSVRGIITHETTTALDGVRFAWEESGIIQWTGGKADLYGWQNK